MIPRHPAAQGGAESPRGAAGSDWGLSAAAGRSWARDPSASFGSRGLRPGGSPLLSGVACILQTGALTRLETRTKESNVHASRPAFKLTGEAHAKSTKGSHGPRTALLGGPPGSPWSLSM